MDADFEDDPDAEWHPEWVVESAMKCGDYRITVGYYSGQSNWWGSYFVEDDDDVIIESEPYHDMGPIEIEGPDGVLCTIEPVRDSKWKGPKPTVRSLKT
jgi:hypothetical protein